MRAAEPEIDGGQPQAKAGYQRRATRASEQGQRPPHERHRRPHTLAEGGNHRVVPREGRWLGAESGATARSHPCAGGGTGKKPPSASTCIASCSEAEPAARWDRRAPAPACLADVQRSAICGVAVGVDRPDVGAAKALVEDRLPLVRAPHLQSGVLGLPVAALEAALLHSGSCIPLLRIHRLDRITLVW